MGVGPHIVARPVARDDHRHHHRHHASASTASTGTRCASGSTRTATRSRRCCSTAPRPTSSPSCSTAAASAARSTWPGTASARAATATSTIRFRTPIAELRSAFYRHLAPVANDWAELLRGENRTFPLEHEALIEQCRAAGQERPTPLILRYGEGDWNALHQDLYGDVYFPFQILTVVSDDFEGGEFVLMEQRPRAQSRAHVLRPPRGAFVIFPTRERPNRGRNGYHRVGMRHGVSTVTRGARTALGVIFHDAR